MSNSGEQESGMVGLAIFLTVVFVLSVVVRFASGAGRGRRRSKAPDVIDMSLETPYDTGAYPIGKIVNLVMLGSFVLALLAWFGSTVRIVPANSVGVPTTFGAIGDRLEPGFHFTNPFTEVHNFSTRLQNSDMLAVVDEGDRNRDDSIEVRGSDGYQMNVDVTVRYSVDSDSASALFKRVGSMDGIRDKIVRPEVREAVRQVFGGYSSEDGYSTGRAKVSADVNVDVKERLANYGLLLDRVDVRNVNPEERLRAAIGDRASAREKAKQAEIEQEKQLTEAETRRQVADLDKQAAITKADADAAAVRIAAVAEAEANAKISASLTTSLIELRRVEALAQANTVYVPSDASIIVNGSNSGTTAAAPKAP